MTDIIDARDPDALATDADFAFMAAKARGLRDLIAPCWWFAVATLNWPHLRNLSLGWLACVLFPARNLWFADLLFAVAMWAMRKLIKAIGAPPYGEAAP
jgi:hypothetical protein